MSPKNENELPQQQSRVIDAADYLTADQKREMADLMLRGERLRLKKLQLEVDKAEAVDSEMERRHEQQQRQLKEARVADVARYEACPHRKGGKDEGGLEKGDDNSRCILWMMTPWGELYGMCTRCGDEAWPPTNKAKVVEYAFARDLTMKQAATDMLKRYKEWLTLPTDNLPMGSQIFSITERKTA